MVERTVKDVVPALKTNSDGVIPVILNLYSADCPQIQKLIASLAEQYKGKDEDFENFKREFNIRAVSTN